MANETGYALDWDSTIENDGADFTLFPHGTECEFEVIELKRERTKATSKLANCPKALVKLKCTHPDHGTTTVTEHLVLHSSCEWKLCQFFTGIGQRQHGEPLRPRWNEVEGTRGRVKLIVEKYQVTTKDGNREERESNKVDRFLDPQPSGNSAASPMPITDDDF